MTNAEQMGNECMASRLRHHSITGVDENDGQVARACARHEISGVLLVTGRIRDDEFPFRGSEVPVGDVDRNALLALRP